MGGKWQTVGPQYQKREEKGGGTTVVQSTFVDPATGAPLVFDKTTGSYKVANVAGGNGATPRPSAFTPESAAKAQLVEQALTYMPQIKTGFLGAESGKPFVNRTNVANAALRMPFTEGRQLSTLVLDAVEAKLRAESGAAVPEPEVKRIAKRYIPQAADDDKTIIMKINNLETFLSGTAQKMNTGRPQNNKPASAQQQKQQVTPQQAAAELARRRAAGGK